MPHQIGIRHAVRCGVLDSPFRGVYLGCNRVDRRGARARAAQLSIGIELPAAFHSAADLHGFGVLDDGRTHLLGGEEHDHSPRPGLLVHATARIPDTVEVAGVSSVGSARAAVDLVRTSHPADGLAVLDAALRCGAVDRVALDHELLLHHWLRGVVTARRLVPWADPSSESPQESRSRWITLAAGLPAPQLQIPVRSESGDYRLDLGYEEIKLGIEYDGDTHLTRSQLRYDRNRQNELGDLGWQFVFLTDRDVFRTPQRTAYRIARRLGLTALRLPLNRDGSLPGGADRSGHRR